MRIAGHLRNISRGKDRKGGDDLFFSRSAKRIAVPEWAPALKISCGNCTENGFRHVAGEMTPRVTDSAYNIFVFHNAVTFIQETNVPYAQLSRISDSIWYGNQCLIFS